MLKITKAQMAVFAEASLSNFSTRIMPHLLNTFPDECEHLGKQGLQDAIRDGIQRAKTYRITTERDVSLYLQLILVLGRDFDNDDAFPWAGLILNQLEQDPSARMERVYMHAMAWEDARAGEP